MGLFVNPSEALLRMGVRSRIYVDKSMLIHELNQLLNTEERFVCVSRARRFGKSMAGAMIAAYYSKLANSRPIFEKLKIAKTPDFETYLNQFNVIHIDVNACYSSSTRNEDIVPLFTANVREELQEQYPNCGIKDTDNLDKCIQRIYSKTGEQFVLILDEYDVLVREKVNATIFNSYLAFLNAMFKNANLSPAFALVYLTGILPIVRDKNQSKLNIFREYTMVNSRQLTEFVGFTQEETEALCDACDMDVDECRRWYEGYHMGEYHIYNPNSVVQAMNDREYGGYWTQTGSYDALKQYILMNFDGIRDDVMNMIAGGKVKVDTSGYLNTMTDFRHKDDVFTYLIHLGYLAYDRKTECCYIPNREIRQQWILSIRDEADYAKAFAIVKHSEDLLDLTIQGDENAVAKAIDDAHTELVSNLQYNNEGCFQSVIRFAYFYANTRYTVISELPAGKGYADIAFIPYIPNTPAMIVELKRNSSTETALSQIENNNYFKALEHYQGDLLFVGVNYDEKTKEHTCEIKRFVKS